MKYCSTQYLIIINQYLFDHYFKRTKIEHMSYMILILKSNEGESDW